MLTQPDLDSPVLFATLPGVVGSDWQRLPVSSDERRCYTLFLQLFRDRPARALSKS